MLSIFPCAVLAIGMSSLEKCLFRCSAHFLIRCFFVFLNIELHELFWKLIPVGFALFAINLCPFRAVCFVYGILCYAKAFKFN